MGFSDGSAGKESAYNGKRHGFNPWVGKIPWRRKMAIHSSVLASKVLCTEEPGRLQSRGSQRVRHG